MDNINLFDSKPDEPILPSLGTASDKSIINVDVAMSTFGTEESVILMSDDIKKAIGGEFVKSLLLKEESFITLPNYVIDYTSLEDAVGGTAGLVDYHADAIDYLMNDDGDAVIYMYTKSGMIKLGRGLTSELDRIIAEAIAMVTSSRAKVYKDFEIGKPPKLLKNKDIASIRLNL